MWRTTVFGQCPACGSGPAFAGWLRLRDACGRCGVRFDRYTGNWLGPAVLAYGLGATGSLALALVLVPRFGFFRGLAAVLAGAGVLVALAAMRPVKAWWIWLLWRSGMVVTDEEAGPDLE
jgi:uncharacterized protein (DUF983 family)